MARIFITGSSDGLGLLAARQLVSEGHHVVLHARHETRAQQTRDKIPDAESVLVADLSDMEETKQLASNVNAIGKFDAVIHNAGVYQAPGQLIVKVNTLAPYILTSLIHPPKRLIYLSSGMHSGGKPRLIELAKDYNHITYSDSKLHILLLTMAVARLWPSVYANAVDPGWVPTKMGGVGAPDSLEKGYKTQVWLAVSDEEAAKVSGHYFYHQRQRPHKAEASEIELQNRFLTICKEITGIPFPV